VSQHRAEARYLQEHGKSPVAITSASDIDALMEALIVGPEYHNMAQVHSLERPSLPSGYPDHELLVGLDGDSQRGVLAFMDAEAGNLVTLGASGEGGKDLSYYIVGQLTEFPGNSEIPIELVRQALNEFLLSGGKRPTSVQWQVPDVW